MEKEERVRGRESERRGMGGGAVAEKEEEEEREEGKGTSAAFEARFDADLDRGRGLEVYVDLDEVLATLFDADWARGLVRSVPSAHCVSDAPTRGCATAIPTPLPSSLIEHTVCASELAGVGGRLASLHIGLEGPAVFEAVALVLMMLKAARLGESVPRGAVLERVRGRRGAGLAWPVAMARGIGVGVVEESVGTTVGTRRGEWARLGEVARRVVRIAGASWELRQLVVRRSRYEEEGGK